MLNPFVCAALATAAAPHHLTPAGAPLALAIVAPPTAIPEHLARLVHPLPNYIQAARDAFPGLSRGAHGSFVMAPARWPVPSIVIAQPIPGAITLAAGDPDAFADVIEALCKAPAPEHPNRARWGDGGEAAAASLSRPAIVVATLLAVARNWREPVVSAHDVALAARIAGEHVERLAA